MTNGCHWCADLGLCAAVDEVIPGCQENCLLPANVTVRIQRPFVVPNLPKASAGWSESLSFISIRLSIPMQYDREEDCMYIFSSETVSLFGEQGTVRLAMR